jgi:phage tail-like protein
VTLEAPETAGQFRVDPPNGRASRANGLMPYSAPPHIPSSSYVQYLPAPYQSDDFVGRYLMIVESILGPIERMTDSMANYFDPRLAPAELLPWLASWVGVELDENWPTRRQRALILHAAELQRWRGTRRALRLHLSLYTGRDPLIVENFDGMRLGQDAMLGANTRIGSAPRPHSIGVTVFAECPDEVDEAVLRHIIESEKPAYVQYALEVV